MPHVTSCPDKRVLEQLMLGRIPAGEAETLEEHVTHCRRCGETLGKLVASDPLVDAMRHGREGEGDAAGSARAAKEMIPWLKRMTPGSSQRTLVSSEEEATLPPAPAAPGRAVTEDATLPPEAGADETPIHQGVPAGDESATEMNVFDFLAPPQGPGEIGRLGTYRVLKLLGAGGMGMVFLAEDPLLKRRIALKVIKPELVERDDVRERFIAEAQAVAKVEHDNIVAIFQVAEDRGVPYLAMPLLRGESLEDRLRKAGGPLALAEILRHSREIAAGLAAAHDKGLVHRDIKPGNIWLEEGRGREEESEAKNGERETQGELHSKTGEPRETKVEPAPTTRRRSAAPSASSLAPRPSSLAPASASRSSPLVSRAKILDFGLAQAAHDLNMDQGKIVGTPAYMAPEQAQGQATDGRADLFSLGCVMYRMATGASPFKGTDTVSTLMNVAMTEPPPPRELNPKVPAALADLIVKLLAKGPANRPASAHDVVKAVEALEEGLRPKPSRLKWLLATAAAVLAGIGLTVWMLPASPPPPEPADITFAYDEPDARVTLQHEDEPPREIDLNSLQTVSLLPGDYRLVPSKTRLHRELVPDHIVVKPGEAMKVELSLVGELAKDHWHSRSVWGVALSPKKGDLLSVSVSGDGSIRIWNLLTDREKGSKELGEHQSEVLCVAISNDGRYALTGSGGKGRRADQSIRLWDLLQAQTDKAPREPIATFLGHNSQVTALAFAPDGKHFLCGRRDGSAAIWDIKEHKVLFPLARHEGVDVLGVAYSPDGKLALTCGRDKLVCLWDPANGKLVKELTGHEAEVRAVAFAPDGGSAASAGYDGTLRIWDLKTGKARVIPTGQKWVLSVAFSPDGKRLLSGGDDGTVRLWNLETDREVYRFQGHVKEVYSVAYAPDGRRALSGGADGTVRLWELPK